MIYRKISSNCERVFVPLILCFALSIVSGGALGSYGTAIIFTGGPGSGKTATLTALEMEGYKVVSETAQDVINLMQAEGVDEPWLTIDFQVTIAKLQLARENVFYGRGKPGLHIFDRTAFDCLAYANWRKFPSLGELRNLVSQSNVLHAKPLVLLFENPQVIPHSRYRDETFDEALAIQARLYDVYGKLGLPIKKVPFMPMAGRIQIVKTLIEGHVGL